MIPGRVKQFERFQQFKLHRKRGLDRPQLVDHIILAEFDIDTGSTVRHKYPGPVPGYSDDWFAEYMLPEGAHNHSLDWTVMFLNKGKPMLDGREEGNDTGSNLASAGDEKEGRTGPFLYCINLVRKKDDPTVRRGAVVKAMAVCSQYHFIEMFRPMLIIALDAYYETLDKVVLEDLFASLNAADLSVVPQPYPHEKRLMRRGVAGRHMGSTPVEHLQHKWTHTLAFEYGQQKIQANMPLHTSADETLTASVTLLMNIFGPAAMKIYNAVLTGQRVLFVGYNHAAGDVCKIVLAACAMVAPPLHGILHRTFPYANLSDLSFLEYDGFVAGVTNPMFESHTEWWDLLCQLDLPNGTGTVLTVEEKQAMDASKGSKAPPKMPARVTLEDLVVEDDAPFSQKVIAGVSNNLDEQWVRVMFYDYTQQLLDMAIDQDTGLATSYTDAESYGKMLAANAWRLKHLRTMAHLDDPRSLHCDPWRLVKELFSEGKDGAIDGVKLRSVMRRMEMENDMDTAEVCETFKLLEESLQSEPSLQVLLGRLPESKAGISPIALGLLNNDPQIQGYAKA
ncbi:unnamed protein product, partial [Chrysoparadoxa australica]